MRDYCIDMALYFDQQGKLRAQVARDREVVRVPLDRGSRGLRDIVGLYVDPPAHAIVLSVDEKSQIQALDRTQPGLPLKPREGGSSPPNVGILSSHQDCESCARRPTHGA
jgi:hypothetical protein